jgi:hypothetical protein
MKFKLISSEMVNLSSYVICKRLSLTQLIENFISLSRFMHRQLSE